jgi:sterol desaturase/sphingolipid hydroxylase (fatty acid hydroxylase superfamily)
MLKSARENFQITRKVSLKENNMGLGMILLIILVLALVGVIPAWPHSNGWGYGPSGGIGLILVIVLILVVLGRI